MMFKKKQSGDNPGNSKPVKKGKNKILRVKISDFVAVSIYDLVTWVGIGLSVGLVLIYGFQGNQRGVRWSVAMLLLFVLIMLAVRVKQHFYSEPTERPRMVVERAIARPLVAGHQKAVSVWLKNRGTATALNITVSINQAFTPPDFLGPLKFTFIDPDSRPDCEPSETVSLMGKSKEPVEQWEIDALNNRKALWFHFGKGVYEDQQSRSYPLDFFAFMYEPSLEGLMRIAPDRYWPDKADSPLLSVQPRPELTLEDARGRCEVGKPPHVTIRIKNRGQITAHRIELETTHYFAHARTFKGPVEHVPNVPPYLYPSLPFNEEVEGHTEGGDPFTSQDKADIEDGKLLWVNYSKGKYEDEAGNEYTFDFCVLYVPGKPFMDIAPRAYWPPKKGYH